MGREGKRRRRPRENRSEGHEAKQKAKQTKVEQLMIDETKCRMRVILFRLMPPVQPGVAEKTKKDAEIEMQWSGAAGDVRDWCRVPAGGVCS